MPLHQVLFSKPLPAPLKGQARKQALSLLIDTLVQRLSPAKTWLDLESSRAASVIALAAKDPTLLVDRAPTQALAFVAVYRNAVPLLEVLAEHGFDFNAQLPLRDSPDKSPLRYAIDRAFAAPGACWLIDQGVRLDVAERDRSDGGLRDLPLDWALWRWLDVKRMDSIESRDARNTLLQALPNAGAPSRAGLALIALHESDDSRTQPELAEVTSALLARHMPAATWTDYGKTFFDVAVQAAPWVMLKVLDAYGLDDSSLYGGVTPRAALDAALSSSHARPDTAAAARAWVAQAAFKQAASELPLALGPNAAPDHKRAARRSVI